VIDPQFDALLDQIPVLAGRTLVEELSGGLTNRNLKVILDSGDALVVRCSSADAGLLGIDRDAEFHNSRVAASAGVAPRVVDYRPDLGTLVIDFVTGTTLSDASFANEEVLKRAAEACRQLHAGPRFTGDFDMFTRQAGYLAIVKERGFRLPEGYEQHLVAFDNVRRVLDANPRPTVPCNNDLLAANFIDDGSRVWLIDYEYSGNNDPCFELGNTATECEFTPELTEAWVRAYFGVERPADLARVHLQSLCSQYGWSLWGFIQAETSPIDYDFSAWGQQRFEKAARTFTSPQFARLLDQAAAHDA
jgi:thiamine kinase-like enzyme